MIEQNEPAIRLYESLGFERTRVLEVWSLTADVPARRRARRGAVAGRVSPTLRGSARTLRCRPGYERLEVDGGAAAIRCADGQVSILQLEADDEEAARLLIAAARARGDSVRFVNIPECDPPRPRSRLSAASSTSASTRCGSSGASGLYSALERAQMLMSLSVA